MRCPITERILRVGARGCQSMDRVRRTPTVSVTVRLARWGWSAIAPSRMKVLPHPPCRRSSRCLPRTSRSAPAASSIHRARGTEGQISGRPWRRPRESRSLRVPAVAIGPGSANQTVPISAPANLLDDGVGTNALPDHRGVLRGASQDRQFHRGGMPSTDRGSRDYMFRAAAPASTADVGRPGIATGSLAAASSKASWAWIVARALSTERARVNVEGARIRENSR
jgi:hypothetical protein